MLQLADDALELADRYSLDEGRLRYVLNLQGQDQVEIVRQIIQFNLTGQQIRDMCEHGSNDNAPDEPIAKETIQLAKLARTMNASSARELAQVLLRQEKDIHVARARLQRLKQVIADAEAFLAET